jgi:membrane associated rhomboid family serine protease
MFPIRDDNPALTVPFVTYCVIALNALAWVFVQGMGAHAQLAHSVCTLGAIPAELLGSVAPGTRVALGPNVMCTIGESGNWVTVFTSMFLHGGWFHIIGNMWFLAIFGDNVEDSMGHARFAVFYLLCGVAAMATQIAASPASTVPMVGASGAIGGVMGAYAFLYPRARVHMLLVLGFWVERVVVPAAFMLGYWFLIQLIGGIPAIGGSEGGIAFWAHVGGFVAGIGLSFVFRDAERVAAHRLAIARASFR